ncbi:hypothetical protein RhiJN_20090 [Ceratobasidium sp. AG-Ba]|nr:hypothetical protein RhiJN_20090 [Ceratobasidium sp. AG-Ba]
MHTPFKDASSYAPRRLGSDPTHPSSSIFDARLTGPRPRAERVTPSLASHVSRETHAVPPWLHSDVRKGPERAYRDPLGMNLVGRDDHILPPENEILDFRHLDRPTSVKVAGARSAEAMIDEHGIPSFPAYYRSPGPPSPQEYPMAGMGRTRPSPYNSPIWTRDDSDLHQYHQ